MEHLIVNADDLGLTETVSEGIVEAHKKGVVTSTSLMVECAAAVYSVNLLRTAPDLGLGLHFQLDPIDQEVILKSDQEIDPDLADKIKKQFTIQITDFKKLTGKNPDHLDSHHHVHMKPAIFPFIKQWCLENKVPYRGLVNFNDEYFSMSNDEVLSVSNLIGILEGLPSGTSELMTHPGHISDNLKSRYSYQRELELSTLTSPSVFDALRDLKIELINWGQIKID